MTFGTIGAIVIVYVAIAVLLLSLNLFSRWHWWVKGAAIVVSGLFFVGAYFSTESLLGWASPDTVPQRFLLIGTRTVEPDKVTGAAGAIYLWLESIDEDNIPSGFPRSYRLGYSDALAETVEDAQDLLNEGEPVEGALSEAEPGDAGEQPQPIGEAGPQSAYGDLELNLVFNDMPAVRLPDKGVL
ncbi:MAG TPA: hypothetical protein VMW31_02920 [Devosiaceae bacterium]|nr:hypothetical protein [Devosiaceae bacterium]